MQGIAERNTEQRYRCGVIDPVPACSTVRAPHDRAGVPDGVDTAWRSKHYLGAPVPGAVRATVNLAQVVAVVEFITLQQAEPLEEEGAAAAKAEANLSATVVELRHAVEEATERQVPRG